jgi:hypothetical protein
LSAFLNRVQLRAPDLAIRLQRATSLTDTLRSYQAPPHRLFLEEQPPRLFENEKNRKQFLENLLNPCYNRSDRGATPRILFHQADDIDIWGTDPDIPFYLQNNADEPAIFDPEPPQEPASAPSEDVLEVAFASSPAGPFVGSVPAYIDCDDADPENGAQSFTMDDFDSLRPSCELTKTVLDYLLGLPLPTDDSSNMIRSTFHLWPSIRIHDPLEMDGATTWSPRTNAKTFDSSRFQVLPYYATCHWQLAVFDTEDYIIFRYDSSWLDDIDRFTFSVRPSQLALLSTVLTLRQVLQQWLDANGGNPESIQYRHYLVTV